MTLSLNGVLSGTPNPASKGPYKFRVCAVDMSGTAVCRPVTLNVFNLNGNYSGSFKGTADYTDSVGHHRQSVHGPVEFGITGLSLAMIEPSGTGTITPLGDTVFGVVGSFTYGGAPCTFAGSFVAGKIGPSKAAGTFHCDINQFNSTGEITGRWGANQQ